MSQIWREVGGGIEVLENINEVADLPDISTIDSEGVWYIESGEFGPDYIAPTNWDSTAGEFTDWFSLFDGQILADIPDRQVYLHDDWGDNQLTSDREDSGEVTHNGVEGVYRPEWHVRINEPDVNDETIVFHDGDMVSTTINLNLEETIEWHFDVEDYTGSNNTGDHIYITLFAESEDVNSTGDEVFGATLEDGYFVYLSGNNDSIQLRETDDSGNSEELIDGSGNIEDLDELAVTRTSDGEWELFENGDSQGTETDTTYTEPVATAIGNRNRGDDAGPFLELSEYKVS